MRTPPSAPIEAVPDLAAPEVRVNSYDAVPYSIGAFPQTHPDRLATIASLFGLSPASPDRCRVLELGCAAGGNLIPMALGSPQSTFVGIDLSKRQVTDGQATVRELGLANIQLRQLDILEVGDDLGTFDYILAHGVYSWVPPEVQQRILTICRRNLAPHGVAYVSYNTYPGWHARGAIREMLWYHTQHFTDPAERISQARALLSFLVVSGGEGDAGYAAILRQELALLMKVPDSYLLHEHLEEFNEPLYFHQFVQRAAGNGMQYLGEAQLSMMLPGGFNAETEAALRKISPDLVHMEQYMDFLRNRMFRQTLLCHAERKIEFRLRPEAVRALRIASSAKSVSTSPNVNSGEPEEFRAFGPATLSTRDPLMKAALAHLAANWPMPVPFPALFEHARATLTAQPAGDVGDDLQLATRLLNCYLSGLVEFSTAPPKFTIKVSRMPVASPYARLAASRGTKVTNMLLQSTFIGEPSALVLRHLDGQHERSTLVELLQGWLREHSITRPQEVVDEYVDRVLDAFARAALLVG